MSNVESESVKDVVIDHQNVPAHVTRDDTGRDYVDMEVNVDNQTPSKVLNKAKNDKTGAKGDGKGSKKNKKVELEKDANLEGGSRGDGSKKENDEKNFDGESEDAKRHDETKTNHGLSKPAPGSGFSSKLVPTIQISRRDAEKFGIKEGSICTCSYLRRNEDHPVSKNVKTGPKLSDEAVNSRRKYSSIEDEGSAKGGLRKKYYYVREKGFERPKGFGRREAVAKSSASVNSYSGAKKGGPAKKSKIEIGVSAISKDPARRRTISYIDTHTIKRPKDFGRREAIAKSSASADSYSGTKKGGPAKKSEIEIGVSAISKDPARGKTISYIDTHTIKRPKDFGRREAIAKSSASADSYSGAKKGGPAKKSEIEIGVSAISKDPARGRTISYVDTHTIKRPKDFGRREAIAKSSASADSYSEAKKGGPAKKSEIEIGVSAISKDPAKGIPISYIEANTFERPKGFGIGVGIAKSSANADSYSGGVGVAKSSASADSFSGGVGVAKSSASADSYSRGGMGGGGSRKDDDKLKEDTGPRGSAKKSDFETDVSATSEVSSTESMTKDQEGGKDSSILVLRELNYEDPKNRMISNYKKMLPPPNKSSSSLTSGGSPMAKSSNTLSGALSDQRLTGGGIIMLNPIFLSPVNASLFSSIMMSLNTVFSQAVNQRLINRPKLEPDKGNPNFPHKEKLPQRPNELFWSPVNRDSNYPKIFRDKFQ